MTHINPNNIGSSTSPMKAAAKRCAKSTSWELWGGFAYLRVFVVPCYPVSIRFIMEKNDLLDDLSI